MTKQNIYGNIHAYTHILNFSDLIPQNGQTHPIKLLGMLTTPWYLVFKGLNSLEINIG